MLWRGLARVVVSSPARRHLSVSVSIDDSLKSAVSRETVHRLRSQGYAVVDNVFGKDLCRMFRSEIEGTSQCVAAV
jgi:hypothetical protein